MRCPHGAEVGQPSVRAGESSGGTVPQEHIRQPGDSALRDWSQLGRRVLAEAWRRFTDDVARHSAATPVARSAHTEARP